MAKSNVLQKLLDCVSSFPFPVKLEPAWCDNCFFSLSACPRLLPRTCPQPQKIIGFCELLQNVDIFIAMCLTFFLSKTCFTGSKYEHIQRAPLQP